MQCIDVIIPAHRAHQTLPRTLASIAAQNILSELSVTVVDDACPEGTYDDLISPFKSRMDLRLIRRSENGGAGAARQTGIDATSNPYFTCIDADDTFLNADSLATLRRGIETSANVKCCAGLFIAEKRDGTDEIIKNFASMDGKLYRRDFIRSYDIRFNGTRSNEDMGYNMLVRLLCDNPNEQLLFPDDTVCRVHYTPDSLTSAGNGQFEWDQFFCGFVDNFIWAVNEAKSYRPFNVTVNQEILWGLLACYTYWSAISTQKPAFAAQSWEYAKKYYHLCYRKFYCPAYAGMEKNLSADTGGKILKIIADKQRIHLPENFVPPIGLKEFLTRLRLENYDPNRIREIWRDMKRSPETRAYIERNEQVGICPKGYADD